MKARSHDDAGGFITLEVMLAIALIGTMFVGATAMERGNSYWILSARTDHEALPAAAETLESTSAAADRDFFHLASSFAPDDPSCTAPGACDGVRRVMTDISTCAKTVDIRTERHLPGYPTRNTAISSVLTDPVEAVALGGDCALGSPSGNWSAPAPTASADIGNGSPAGLDVYQGIAYIVTDKPPYLRIVTPQGPVAFANAFIGEGPFNAVDVGRNVISGRIYAYVAAVSPQLQIIDVTDPHNPQLTGSAPLAGITLKGAQAQAWRIFVYGGTAYVTARYMISANPEIHAFDVNDPENPQELGRGYKASTSIYGIVVHAQSVRGTQKRLAYLATTSPTGELKVLDVTDPTDIVPVASCDLPGNYRGNVLTLLGTTLYLGRDTVTNGGEELFAFDASDPSAPSFCQPTGKTTIGTDVYSRHVEAVRASGPYLFVATTNTTDAHGQLQIRNADPSSNLALLGTYALPGLAENALDFENNTLYAASTASPHVQALTAE